MYIWPEIVEERRDQKPRNSLYVPCLSRSRDQFLQRALVSPLTFVARMAAGVVRAAFCSFLTESVDLSPRNTEAKKGVRVFLEEVAQDRHFGAFDDFTTSIERCVTSEIRTATSCRAKSVLREKLWRSFHFLRLNELNEIWKKLYATLKKKLDPLVQQQVNEKLFEGVLKTHLDVPSQAARYVSSSVQEQELTEAEEQIVRYGCWLHTHVTFAEV